MADNVCAAFRVDKQVLALGDVVHVDAAGSAVCTGEDTGRGEKLECIPQAGLAAVFGHLVESCVGDVEALCLGAQADNGLDFLRGVRVGGDDEQAREEVGRNTVRGYNVVGAADDGVAAIRRQDDNRGDGGLEGAVEVGEAFNIEHVDLLNAVRLSARTR